MNFFLLVAGIRFYNMPMWNSSIRRSWSTVWARLCVLTRFFVWNGKNFNILRGFSPAYKLAWQQTKFAASNKYGRLSEPSVLSQTAERQLLAVSISLFRVLEFKFNYGTRRPEICLTIPSFPSFINFILFYFSLFSYSATPFFFNCLKLIIIGTTPTNLIFQGLGFFFLDKRLIKIKISSKKGPCQEGSITSVTRESTIQTNKYLTAAHYISTTQYSAKM